MFEWFSFSTFLKLGFAGMRFFGNLDHEDMDGVFMHVNVLCVVLLRVMTLGCYLRLAQFVH